MIGHGSPQAFVTEENLDRARKGLKNHIINGCMRKNSEGAASYTATGYSLDQHKIGIDVSSVIVTQEDVALGTAGLNEDTVKVKKTVLTSVVGAGAHCLDQYVIEGARTLAGKQVTLAFSGKADAAKDVAIEVSQDFGSGGSPSSDVLTYMGTVTLGTAFARHELTFTMPSVSAKTLGTNGDDFARILIWMESGSTFDSRTNNLGQQSGTFETTEVGLYEGAHAPPWQGEDLAVLDTQCARFYVRYAGDGGGATSSYIAVGACYNTTQIYTAMPYSVDMRTVPTVAQGGTIEALTNATPKVVTAQSAAQAGNHTMDVRFDGTGLITGQSAAIRLLGAASYLDFNARL